MKNKEIDSGERRRNVEILCWLKIWIDGFDRDDLNRSRVIEEKNENIMILFTSRYWFGWIATKYENITSMPLI